MYRQYCKYNYAQAVALLAEMPTRRVKPDVVCFGAAIGALKEVAGTQNRSTWGVKDSDQNGGGSGGEALFWVFSRIRF